MVLYQLADIRWSGCGPHLVEPVYRLPAASPEASIASEAAAWRRCDPGSGRRLCKVVLDTLLRCSLSKVAAGATQQRIAVVQPRSDDATRDYLGDVVSQ